MNAGIGGVGVGGEGGGLVSGSGHGNDGMAPSRTDHLRKIVICANCRKRIHKQRNGAWYHSHNASVSCRPGQGSGMRAEPVEVEPVSTRGERL